MELESSDAAICCVKCHPQIYDAVFILQDDGTFSFYSPSCSPAAVLSVNLSVSNLCPVSFSFGSDVLSDRFSLYVAYSTGSIGLISPLPLPVYSLEKREFCNIYKKGDPSIHWWLENWEQKSDSRMYSSSLCTRPINLVFLHETSSGSYSDVSIWVFVLLFSFSVGNQSPVIWLQS